MGWTEHIYGDENNVGLIRVLSKRVGILSKIRRFTTPKNFIPFLNGILMSKLFYGITAWGCVSGIPGQPDNSRAGFTKRDLLRLQAVQNKAVRLIHYRDRLTPTRELLKEANILSINQYIAYQVLTQTFKIKDSHLPEYHYGRLFDENYRLSRTRSDNMKRVDFRLNI